MRRAQAPLIVPRRTVAIVDPCDAGAMLAPALADHGIAAVMVPSSVWPDPFDPSDFAAVLPWQKDVSHTIAALRRHGIARVLAGSERGVMLADRLGEALGLPGNGIQLSATRRDKFHMIQQVGRHGIRVPSHCRSDRLADILAWMDAGGHWPAVLKPCRSKGSDGVRLCATREEAARAFCAIHGRADLLGGRNATVLAQQYLCGREYVVDTVSLDGRHRLAALWEYGKPAPGFDTVGLLATKTLLPPDDALADRLFAFAMRVLDALGIHHGAGHCELILDSDGPVLVEIGARLHGGPPAHLLCRAATGTSQLDLLVHTIHDPAAFLAGSSPRYALAGGAAMALLRDTGLKGQIEALPSAQRIVWNPPAGDPPPLVAGLATLIHSDPRVVAADLEIASGAIDCDLLERRDAIEAIAPDWRALLDRARCNRAFSGPACYLAALGADPGLAPRVIIASRGGALAGVFPLVRDAATLRFATALSDYNDVIVAAGDIAAARRLMIFARARVPALELACVRDDSDCARAANSAPRLAEKRYICPFADLSSGYDAWRATRSAGFRRRLDQAERHAERHDLRATRLAAQQLADPAALFLALHHARFGDRSLFHRDRAARGFVECALPRLLDEGSALLFGLWAQDRVIGLNVCMRGADSLGYWNAGFLPEFAGFSPGTLMIHVALRAACAQGLAEFDFLRGAEAYKLRWATGARAIGRLA